MKLDTLQPCTTSGKVRRLIAHRKCTWERWNASQRTARRLLNMLQTTQSCCLYIAVKNAMTLRVFVLNTYCMDLNFCSTKLSRIKNFHLFRIYIFADACPTILYLIYWLYICTSMCFAYVAFEVRKRTLYRKLILRKWCLQFPNNFDVIVDVVLDCLVYACKTSMGILLVFVSCACDSASDSYSGDWIEGDTQDARELVRWLAYSFWRRRHSPSITLIKVDAEDRRLTLLISVALTNLVHS